MENVFNTLNAINVSDKTEKKNGLTYLSWAWAWGRGEKLYPDAQCTVYEKQGRLVLSHRCKNLLGENRGDNRRYRTH